MFSWGRYNTVLPHFDVKTKGIIKQSKGQMEEKKLSILLLVCTIVMATMLVMLFLQEKKLYDYKRLISSIDCTTIVTTDTVYQTKTLTDTIPQYITRWKTKTDTLFKLKENDTIPHLVELKGKTYSNTITDDKDTIEYQAHVSGYDVDSQEYPRLDSIGFTLRRFVKQTNTTQVVKAQPKRQFITTSPSVTFGYDPFNKQWGAMVGVSVNFNVWNK